MEDNKIIELYFSRNENAISETLLKYKRYCEKIAGNIIGNKEDTEECVNTSLLDVWNNIQPKKPDNFRVYIGRIVKNNAIDIYKRLLAQKRGCGSFEEILDEASEISDGNKPEQTLERREIIKAINDYLYSINEKKRMVFVLRYWQCCEISYIAGALNLTEANVYNILKRERKKLTTYLKKRGVL